MQIAATSLAQSRIATAPQDQKITKASKDFESMFMAQMLQPMFESVETSSDFGGGHGEEAMRGFLVQEYGKAMAAGTDFGLASSVKAELIRLQGAKAAASALPVKG